MRLQRLTLRNFQGIRELTFEPNGRDATVYGQNEAGKTTLASAFTWLLFSKDAMWRSVFEIKTLDENSKPVHGLEHEVEAVLDFGGEQSLTLRKVYKELWQKKRGSAESVFTGNTTDHYVNGVPVQKKEYDSYVAAIAEEKVFKILTSPTYFPEQLPWQERRRVLMEVAGVPVSKGFDDRLKELKHNQREINAELDKLPARMDEVERGLPDRPDMTADQVRAALIAAEKIRADGMRQRVQIEQGGGVAEKTKELREAEAAVLDAENRARQAASAKVKPLLDRQGELLLEKSRLEARLRDVPQIVAGHQEAITRLDVLRNKLRAEWQALREQSFVPLAGADVCPACGQSLPQEQVQAAYEKAVAEFNQRKAMQLEDITARGKAAKKEAEDRERDKAARVEDAGQAAEQLEMVKSMLDAVVAEMALLTESDPQGADTLAAQERVAALKSEIETLRNSNADLLQQCDAFIRKADEDIAALRAIQARIEQRKAGEERMVELKDRQRQLAAEFERLERELHHAEQEIKDRVRAIEEKINSRFKLSRFKLFQILINGGVEECCEVLYKGVPYSGGLNTGGRVLSGVDIIATLCDHYNLYPPLWIDNAESVDNIPNIKGQMIRLYKRLEDKKLRVEVEKND